MLHVVLDNYASETKALRREVQKIVQEQDALRAALEQTRKLKRDLEEELQNEKSKWKIGRWKLCAVM